MRRRDLVRTFFGFPLIDWRPLRLFSSIAQTNMVGPNAASFYAQAYQGIKAIGPGARSLIRSGQKANLSDPEVLSLLDHTSPIVEAVRRGAAVDDCDWGMPLPSLSDLDRSSLDIMNVDAIRLICLNARKLASRGQGHAAIDDLFAGWVMAYRIGSQNLIIARVFQTGGETVIFQTLGRLLFGFDAKMLADVAHRLERLPESEYASAIIKTESGYIVRSLIEKLATMGPKLDDAGWQKLLLKPEHLRTLRELTRDDRLALIEHIHGMDPAFAELGRCLDLTRDEFVQATQAFLESRRAASPIVASFVNEALNVRIQIERSRTRRAMVRAGVALSLEGEIGFSRVSDPSTDGPFLLETRGREQVVCTRHSDLDLPELILPLGPVR